MIGLADATRKRIVADCSTPLRSSQASRLALAAALSMQTWIGKAPVS